MHDFDGADLIDRSRQQPANSFASMRIVVIGRPRSRVSGGLDDHDDRDHHGQKAPDHKQTRTGTAWIHLRLHHMAMPINASRAGTRMTERKTVARICRFVRLTRGTS